LDGRPQRIRCYKMCSIDSGLWCWESTTQAASDDAPSQRWGSRGVLSFFFEVRMRHGRVTLPCKSLPGVRAPNSMDMIHTESHFNFVKMHLLSHFSDLIRQSGNIPMYLSAKTDTASDPSALRPDPTEVFSASPASCVC